MDGGLICCFFTSWVRLRDVYKFVKNVHSFDKYQRTVSEYKKIGFLFDIFVVNGKESNIS